MLGAAFDLLPAAVSARQAGVDCRHYSGVQLGDYKCTAPFGVITDCNSPDFNGVDGILGFGLPKAGEEGRELPTPLLFAMTDQENKMSNARDLTRKFSFFSTDTDGTCKGCGPSMVCKGVPQKRWGESIAELSLRNSLRRAKRKLSN